MTRMKHSSTTTINNQEITGVIAGTQQSLKNSLETTNSLETNSLTNPVKVGRPKKIYQTTTKKKQRIYKPTGVTIITNADLHSSELSTTESTDFIPMDDEGGVEFIR